MSRTLTKAERTYAYIFAYCVPKKKHEEMLNVMTKPGRIYRRHGSHVWR